MDNEELEKELNEISKDGDWCGCYEGDLEGLFPKQQEKLKQFILQREEKIRKQLIKEIKDKNFQYVDNCEPDCDAVRHALHQGSWEHHWRMQEYLESLENENNSTKV